MPPTRIRVQDSAQMASSTLPIKPCLGRLSGDGLAVIKGDGVFRLGEEQPAFDENAERGEGGGESCGESGRPAGGKQRDQPEEEGQGEGGEKGDAAQLGGMLAADLKPHLLEEVVFRRVRCLEQPHRAESAEPRGAPHRADARAAVEKAPITELQSGGEKNSDKTQPGDASAPGAEELQQRRKPQRTG